MSCAGEMHSAGTAGKRRRTINGCEAGVFEGFMQGLAAPRAEPQTAMIDATYPKVHRMGLSLRVEGAISTA